MSSSRVDSFERRSEELEKFMQDIKNKRQAILDEHQRADEERERALERRIEEQGRRENAEQQHTQQRYLKEESRQRELQMTCYPEMTPYRSSPVPSLASVLRRVPDASPGPNAFAEQKEEYEKHLYQNNAFYQQAFDKEKGPRKATPPTAIHPALRNVSDATVKSPRTHPALRSTSNDTVRSPHQQSRSVLTPTSESMDSPRRQEAPLRFTPSPLGFEQPHHQHSLSAATPTPGPTEQRSPQQPPLKLVPSLTGHEQPTDRAFIENYDTGLMPSARNTPVPYRPKNHYEAARILDQEDKANGVTRESTTYVDPRKPPQTPKKATFMERLGFKIGGSPEAPKPWDIKTRRKSDAAEQSLGGKSGGEHMAVKAQSVLGVKLPSAKKRLSFGASETLSAIERTPSKRKKPFLSWAKRRPGAGEIEAEKELLTQPSGEALTAASRSVPATHDFATATASTTNTTPATGHTNVDTPRVQLADNERDSFSMMQDTAHSPLRSKKNRNEDLGRETVNLQRAMGRSTSLKYIDHAPPPTPPEKNTPPHKKGQGGPHPKVQRNQPSSRVPFQTDNNEEDGSQPGSKSPPGLISTSGRISPTKYGTYGTREVPQLVTRPSTNSMHASVVPSEMDLPTFHDLKARHNGLNLEGFSMPAESTLELPYSPSVYSRNTGPGPRSAMRPETRASPRRFTIRDEPNHQRSQSVRSKPSDSTMDVPVYFPDLHIRRISKGKQPLSTIEQEPSPDHSRGSSLRAACPSDDQAAYAHPSPAHTAFTHASAAPSPLQIRAPPLYYLSPDTYKPSSGNGAASPGLEDSPTLGYGAQTGAGFSSPAPASMGRRPSFSPSTPCPEARVVDPVKPGPVAASAPAEEPPSLDGVMALLRRLEMRVEAMEAQRASERLPPVAALAGEVAFGRGRRGRVSGGDEVAGPRGGSEGNGGEEQEQETVWGMMERLSELEGRMGRF